MHILLQDVFLFIVSLKRYKTFFLKRHKRLQHDETPCKECGLKFHGSNELSRHIRKEHLTGNEHICELCGMGFKMKTYLKRHLRQQHPGNSQFLLGYVYFS